MPTDQEIRKGFEYMLSRMGKSSELALKALNQLKSNLMSIEIGDTVEIIPEYPTYTRALDDNGEWQFVELEVPAVMGVVTGIRDTTRENKSFREYHIDGKWHHSRYIKHADKE